MSKSVFIVNMPTDRAIHAQVRKFRNDMGNTGLGLEGPFSDSKHSLAPILEAVLAKMTSSGMDPVSATALTLLPVNTLQIERPLLDTPFVFSFKSLPSFSSGDVASKEPISTPYGNARAIDLEDLVLLTVGVLRRLGLPSFVGYMHYDGNSPHIKGTRALLSVVGGEVVQALPVVFIPEPEPQILGYPFPRPIPIRVTSAVTGYEILSDDALLSLATLRSVSLQTERLMAAVRTNPTALPNIDPTTLGHMLYRGAGLWLPRDGETAIKMAGELTGRDVSGITSVRTILETDVVHDTGCQPCHTVKAMEKMLCDRAQAKLREPLGAVIPLISGFHGLGSSRIRVDFSDLFKIIADHTCVQALTRYLKLAEDMHAHTHDGKTCNASRYN
ncbi:Uncharacterised protein [Candidatus Bilamarchaeum dharawalense]|uniref:Uncharacterized protein n=1 Tax=Candidatus Bilamarchaeum dharawalense TaxID=2885759 RepID=A0A5E4LTK6_9ARCH|nr:Uncharacterised protein [Candidatus Bilamarchaeum dharawalense]